MQNIFNEARTNDNSDGAANLRSGSEANTVCGILKQKMVIVGSSMLWILLSSSR